MDRMRVLAFAFIIIYHYIFELEQMGNFDTDKVRIIQYSNSNVHIAMTGVSLFFMISGAGLMLSSMRKCSRKDFYSRRLTKVLIPFYVAEIFALIASYAIKREWLLYFPFISKVKIILNFLGMDGYFEQYFKTFSLHVGEWFLGALIMLYIVFPLLRFFMEKNRYITIIVATVYYGVINFAVHFSTPPWTNVAVKVYDFILGMFLVMEIPKLMEKKRFRLIACIVSAAVIVTGIFLKPEIPIPDAMRNLIFAVAIFIFAFSLEFFGARNKVIDGAIEKICAIAYEVFLVHHIVIYYIGDQFNGAVMKRGHMIALFVTEVIVMIALALLVKGISTPILGLFKRKQK